MGNNATKPNNNVTIEGNWLDYGSCSVNINDKGITPIIQNFTLANNKFGKNQQWANCAMIIGSTIVNEPTTTIDNNVWEDDSSPAAVTNGG